MLDIRFSQNFHNAQGAIAIKKYQVLFIASFARAASAAVLRRGTELRHEEGVKWLLPQVEIFELAAVVS